MSAVVLPDSRGPVRLTGGIVAFNEASRVGRAIRSLLDQELPPGVQWDSIWVVASGCTDGTGDVVRAIAREDPHVHLIEQPERQGKSAALEELFHHVRGEYLVLLNGDAQGHPGAVCALFAASLEVPPGFAVMGRPVPPAATRGFSVVVELMWGIHHRFHLATVGRGEGSHLSDELMLLPVSHLPPLSAGIINDGAFVGAWLKTHGGRLRYAAEARVDVSAPRNLREHLRQRRRIQCGHHQVYATIGIPPTTLPRWALHHPREAVQIVFNEARSRPGGFGALVTLVAGEVVALALSLWDRLPPRRDHAIWKTIQGFPGEIASESRLGGPIN